MEEININDSPSVSELETAKIEMTPELGKVETIPEPVKAESNLEPINLELNSEPVKLEATPEPVKVEMTPEPVKVEMTPEPVNLESNNLKVENLGELNLDLNEQTGGNPIVSPNVKVIKISADAGTLNMINK